MNRITRVFDLARIELKHKGPHALRHTFATLELQRTGNIKYVQEALGHSKVGTTERYAEVGGQRVKEIVQQSTLWEMLGEGNNERS